MRQWSELVAVEQPQYDLITRRVFCHTHFCFSCSRLGPMVTCELSRTLDMWIAQHTWLTMWTVTNHKTEICTKARFAQTPPLAPLATSAFGSWICLPNCLFHAATISTRNNALRNTRVVHCAGVRFLVWEVSAGAVPAVMDDGNLLIDMYELYTRNGI